MNFNILIIIVCAIFTGIVVATVGNKVRRAFLVPEGYVGLLYCEGKFLEVLHAGRHIRWGLHYTLDYPNKDDRNFKRDTVLSRS